MNNCIKHCLVKLDHLTQNVMRITLNIDKTGFFAQICRALHKYKKLFVLITENIFP